MLRANEVIFLSYASSLLGYNGTPLRLQGGKTSVQKLLLSGKNHEAFQKQHFPGQPICLVYI